MRWNIRKWYKRLIRREGADIVIALTTGILTNLITDAIDRRREARTARTPPLAGADRERAESALLAHEAGAGASGARPHADERARPITPPAIRGGTRHASITPTR